MIINNYWAVCEVSPYFPFENTNLKVAYLSEELFNYLKFKKPNLCDLVIKNKKYEFFTLPFFDSKNELNEKNNINNYLKKDSNNSDELYFKKHFFKIPIKIYHELIGYCENPLAQIRTDIFFN